MIWADSQIDSSIRLAKMITKFTFFAAILLNLIVVNAVQGNTEYLDKTIAIVNDEAITLSEYQARYRRFQLQSSKKVGPIPKELNVDVLRLMIDERLQTQTAASYGITISPPEVDSALEAMARQNNLSADQLLEELRNQGITPEQFRRSIEEQQLIQRVIDIAVKSRVTVSDQEVDYHLQSHKELYTSEEAYEVSHLYISTAEKSDSDIARELENAKFIHQGLEQGQPFEKAVENYSDGENKQEGGFLGWRKDDQLPELFLQALRNTPVGGVTEILESSNGFHILKLHSKEGDSKIVTQQLVRHILIQPARHGWTANETIKKLNEIAEQINQDGDFSKHARLNSDDEITAVEGGAFGWINPGSVAPAIERVIKDLPLNTLSAPIESVFGYHLVEVLDRRKRDISLDVERANAKSELFKRKASDLYKSWFDQLRDGAYIELIANN